MYKVITSKGPQGDYTREQIVGAVKRGKLAGKSVVLDSETGKYLEALDLFRTPSPTTERAHASPSESPRNGNVATVDSATRPSSQEREQSASRLLVGIVVAALLLFAVSAIITPWFIGSEQTPATNSSNSTAQKPDLAPEQPKAASHSIPTYTTPTSEIGNTDEKERWREEERKRLLEELTKKRDEATATERPPETAPPKTSDSQPSEKPSQSAVDRFKETAARFNPSVFLIYVAWEVRDGQGVAKELSAVAGTAWLADDGLLVTNKHVLYPFLFNPIQCHALQWLCQNDGWRVDPTSVFIAAFPCGAKLRNFQGDKIRFDDAWIYDGTSQGVKGQGTLRFVGALPNDWERTDWHDSKSNEDLSVVCHAVESSSDLALLELVGGAQPAPLPLASNEELLALKQLDQVMTLGYPLAGNVDDGIVLSTEPALGTIRSVELELSRIRSTASTTHGNSGGPLISLDGKVIGVSARGTSSDRNTSITSGRVRALLSGSTRVNAVLFSRELEDHFPSRPARTRIVNGASGEKNEKPSTESSSRTLVDSLKVSVFKKSPHSCWTGLKKGMSKLEVRNLLGATKDESQDSLCEIWNYPDSKGGRVFFDKEKGTLKRWIAPWERLGLAQTGSQVKKFIGVCDQVVPTESGEYWVYRMGERLLVLYFSNDSLGEIQWKD